MKRLPAWSVALASTAMLLTGCAQASTTTTGTTQSSTPHPGMMASAAAAGKPTATQAMICGPEIHGEVTEVLKLSSQPAVHPTYADSLFTCIYDLPVGPMRLSVQHSATEAAALSYLSARRVKIGAMKPAAGLGDHAYANGTGVVLLVKDNETLEVDTTALPKVFGSEDQRRSDLAYEVASVVLTREECP
jgi:hypothetical protein